MRGYICPSDRTYKGSVTYRFCPRETSWTFFWRPPTPQLAPRKRHALFSILPRPQGHYLSCIISFNDWVLCQDLIISIHIYLKYKYTCENAGFLYTLYKLFQNIKNFKQTIEIFHDFSPRNVTGANLPTPQRAYDVSRHAASFDFL